MASGDETERVALAAACRDADAIPKHPLAGQVLERGRRRVQVMHNGLEVVADGYYGEFITRIISKLRGHHEPQEEKVFHAVLSTLGPSPVMIELGGYWSYYSLWFLKARPKGRAIIVEPIASRLEVSRANFGLNGMRAEFVMAAVGAADSGEAEFCTGAESSIVPRVSVDGLRAERNVTDIDILHLDIQGFEGQALRGATKLLAERAARWIFVSTHRHLEDGRSMDLHEDCLCRLIGAGYDLVAAHTPEESYSTDGLIVVKRPGAPGPDRIMVSNRLHQHDQSGGDRVW